MFLPGIMKSRMCPSDVKRLSYPQNKLAQGKKCDRKCNALTAIVSLLLPHLGFMLALVNDIERCL